jgi:hypothetical protein
MQVATIHLHIDQMVAITRCNLHQARLMSIENKEVLTTDIRVSDDLHSGDQSSRPPGILSSYHLANLLDKSTFVKLSSYILQAGYHDYRL